MLTLKNMIYNNGIKEGKKTCINEPPRQITNKVCFGSYCIRATVQKMDENDKIVNVYYGYSENIDEIISAVENTCDRRKKKNENCGNASIMFLKKIENCQGMITENDKNGNNPIILRYNNK